MTDTADIAQLGDTFFVSGSIGFENVMSLYQKSLPLLKANSAHWQVDLSQLTNASSAAVALLIEWKKWAHLQNKNIQFIAIPEKLSSIIHAAKLDELIPIQHQVS